MKLTSALRQLLRLYERNVPEGSDPETVPADVVHHFLLALCSRPGVGLCFADRGWYPRETDEEQRSAVDSGDGHTELDTAQKGGKIYNKILANVVKTLKVNEDPRQQELALKVLSACPELVSGYWASAGLALEPRLSSKWLANIAFFGAVVSLPVPTTSFFLPESGSTSTSLYRPSPPPLSTIVDNILPTAHIKNHLSRGLQSSSPLVQHASALALAKSLLKYQQVVQAFEQVERALEEDEDGLWTRRHREVEREVRKRVPDFQVIVGFSQRYNDPASAEQGPPKENQKQSVPNPTRTALLAESAHRLLWLYHQLLPSVVAEARFDAGKLLHAIEDMLAQGSSASPTAGLDTLRQLHVLRLLRESEHFTWSGKSGNAPLGLESTPFVHTAFLCRIEAWQLLHSAEGIHRHLRSSGSDCNRCPAPAHPRTRGPVSARSRRDHSMARLPASDTSFTGRQGPGRHPSDGRR